MVDVRASLKQYLSFICSSNRVISWLLSVLNSFRWDSFCFGALDTVVVCLTETIGADKYRRTFGGKLATCWVGRIGPWLILHFGLESGDFLSQFRYDRLVLGDVLLHISRVLFKLNYIMAVSRMSLPVGSCHSWIRHEWAKGQPTLVLMCFARSAYSSVLRLSSKWIEAGLIAAIITVLELPPKLSFSSRVNLLSR